LRLRKETLIANKGILRIRLTYLCAVIARSSRAMTAQR
jgi:hypothetical protein